MEIKDLIIGNTYSAKEYSEVFECSYMSGMNYSKKTKTLVLISKQNNGIYNDKWESKILHYTGQGTVGDQTLTRNNKILFESKEKGTKVFLFEVFNKGEYFYQGEVELAEKPYQVNEPDVNGNIRIVWKFPIKKIDNNLPTPIQEEEIIKIENKAEMSLSSITYEELKEKAYGVDGIVSERPVVTLHRTRNPYVSKHVKNRANGVCDLCGKEAPFNNKDNTPYLESHHVIKISDNGPDVVYNAVALCPNCHKKLHILEDPEDIKKLSNIILKYLIEDDAEEQIELHRELFKD